MLAAQIFNTVEAAFWFALAALCIAAAHRANGFTPRRQFTMTAFLIAFGVSDLWELASGWSQPAALFAFKAFCLIGLTITSGLIYRTRWTTV